MYPNLGNISQLCQTCDQLMDKANQSLHGEDLQLAIIVANRPRVDGPASINMRKFHLHSFRWRPVASLEFLPVRDELGVLRIDLDDAVVWNHKTRSRIWELLK